MSETASPSSRPPKPEMTFRLLEQKLRELLPSRPQEIHLSDRFETIIPPEDRRRVWRNLRHAGFNLPSLNLSGPVSLIAVGLVLTVVLMIAVWFGIWFIPLSLTIAGILAYWLTRPWAIYPPDNCKTLYQAACYVARCNPQTYQAGLWSREEVALKVRQVLSEASCIDLKEIRGDMTMEQIFGL